MLTRQAPDYDSILRRQDSYPLANQIRRFIHHVRSEIDLIGFKTYEFGNRNLALGLCFEEAKSFPVFELRVPGICCDLVYSSSRNGKPKSERFAEAPSGIGLQ